jgi:polyphosphate glucokinase
MKGLAIDIGGTHVKLLASGEKESRKFPSGPGMTPEMMVAGVGKLAADWSFEVISVGYPGPVLHNRPVTEPHNLGRGWISFDFQRAFKCRVKFMNDAAMQALGSYRGGKLLFLGLGTGLGTTMIVDGIIEPMELGHLPYKKATYEDYIGLRGLERYGERKWRKHVVDVIEQCRPRGADAEYLAVRSLSWHGRLQSRDRVARRRAGGVSARAARSLRVQRASQ